MPPAEAPETPSFTESFQTLEEILAQFRSGPLSLEESLKLFESGIHHIQICQDKLSQARGRVEELMSSLQSGGEIITRPFDEEEDS